MGKLKGKRVLILGVAFRGNVRETGFSMAKPLISELTACGADVRVHDAVFTQHEVEAMGYCWEPPDTGWPEVVILQADHTAYLHLGPKNFPMAKVVMDGRDFWETETWDGTGVRFLGIGR